MVSPEALLALAAELVASQDEVKWRCAMSRAYYAVFHAARTELRKLGFATRQSDQAHVAISRRWSHCGHSSLSEIGDYLSELRTNRNLADYDLDRSFGHFRAQSGVTKANQILGILRSNLSNQQQAKLVEEIRRYERDVLRDVTWISPN